MSVFTPVAAALRRQPTTPPVPSQPSTASSGDQWNPTGDLPAQPDPVDVQPRVGGRPIGGSGRAHWSGFIQSDEYLPELIGIRGLLKFDQMYFSDPYIRRLVLMIWSLIESGTWSIDPYGGDNAQALDRSVADKVWWWLTEYLTPNLYGHLGEVGPVLLRSGFSPFEQIWRLCTRNPEIGQSVTAQSADDTTDPTKPPPTPDPSEPTEKEGVLPQDEKLALPYKLALRLPRTIMQFPQDELEDLAGIVQILPTGVTAPIPASELVYYRIQCEGDNWTGRSLLRQAFRPWYCKWHLEEIEAIGLERKAMGFPICYPPINATGPQKDAMSEILATAHTGEAAYMMAPGPHQQYDKDSGWLIDVIKYDSSSGGEINDAINRHQDGIAASFLGDFMSLGHHQVGAKATAEVQEDPFLTAGSTLIQPVLAPLNKLIARVVRMNWPQASGPPKLKCAITDTASLSEIATFMQLLVTVGVIQPDPELEDWARSRAQMPVANGILRKFGFASQVARLQAQITGSQAAQQAPQVESSSQESSDGIPGNDQPDNFAQGKPGGAASKPAGKPPVQKGKQLDDVLSGKWWEQLLAKQQLGDALKSAKGTVTAAASEPAQRVAAHMATAAATGSQVARDAPPELVNAFEAAFGQLYQLGYQAAAYELDAQHAHLGTGRKTQLMSPSSLAAAAGARISRVRDRARIAARSVVQTIATALDRAKTGGADSVEALRAHAQRVAAGQLQVEAAANAMDLINAGRFDLADSNAADIAQAQYTACMDENTCDDCSSEDGEIFTDLADAAASVPNGMCAGGPDRCRCTVIFMLSDDPRALSGLQV